MIKFDMGAGKEVGSLAQLWLAGVGSVAQPKENPEAPGFLLVLCTIQACVVAQSRRILVIMLLRCNCASQLCFIVESWVVYISLSACC